ncbi:MAG: PAS domain S-box protein [Bacteroidales bacterium]|nr:PAS domain S-box protein [Bacteroidales bacterium]
MSNKNQNKTIFIVRYTIAGFITGLIFPVFGWSFYFFLDKYAFNVIAIKTMHINNPMYFILDITPVILGIISFFIARKIIKTRSHLINKINSQKKIIKQYENFAKQIGEGEIAVEKKEYTGNFETDKTLLLMQENFIEKQKNENELNWVTSGKEKVADILRKHNDLNNLIKDVLISLIEYTGSVQGAFFLFNESENKLINSFSYAYGREKHIEQKFKIGEGIVGQSAYEKEYIYRRNLPKDYITISSGLLGEQSPGALITLPLIGNEKIQGVIEIAGLKSEYSEKIISFLIELKEIIGQTLFNFKANLTTKKLLEDARNLTEQLQKNEQELRENANKMELTQIELEKSNIELASKISEVETGQKRLHALLENASEVITIYDTDGIVQYVSPSVKTILGFTPDEMLGINRFERGDKILQEAFNELLINPDIEKIIEYQYTNKNKERVWLETRGRNLSDNPAINGIIFNTRDITIKKEVENAKRLSSEMQALSENSLDMIVRVDQAGNFYYANPMTEQFIGKTSQDLIHKNINNVDLDQEVLGFFKEIINKTNIAGEEIQVETTFMIGNKKRIVQFNSIPETDEKGIIRTFLFVVHDITEQKEIELEIETKNKNITESINYAQRIQSAIVPDINIIKRYLPESFVFYKPRDVVSGDLPWFYAKDDEIYIAAIDCTGHGVPGTLLSFIGYFSLNNIVGKEENLTTGEILDELHYQVRRTLRQDSPDSKARDGMDIAICKINSKKNTLEFAGAHNALFLLRGENVTRYKGDRKAVGGKPIRSKRAEIEKKFTTFKIDIEKKDKIFIFTDGLPDQIGGEEGRKYQAGRIQKQIIEKNNFSMTQYYDFFVTQFENWKKGYKQIDDVLLIGIEF